MRSLAALVPLAWLGGCGYVGEPLPPLLNIPARVTDLRVVERGARIVIEFTPPELTTESVRIRRPPRIDLRAGLSQGEFNSDAWAATARQLEARRTGEGKMRAELPVAEWVGKEVFFGVIVFGYKGRHAGWSNFVALTVTPPLATPEAVEAQAVPQGVRVTWKGSAPRYRVWRRTTTEDSWHVVATVDSTEWLDTATEFGRLYEYQVQAVQSAAESEISTTARLIPEDKFAPAAPAGLQVIAGADSIELAWEPNREPDLAGYRVYRALDDAPLAPLTGTQENPSYSDRTIEPGKRYRYGVSAVDRLGNESAPSAAVDVTAPQR